MFSSECNRAFIHLVEDKVKSFQEPEHLMIPMGNDFHYQDASINYRNMDKAMPALPFLLEAHFSKRNALVCRVNLSRSSLQLISEYM